jgi:transposase
MIERTHPAERLISLDCHPDTFTAAILRGPTPAAAVVEKVFNQIPIKQLESWTKKNTTAQDLFVLEASGNSFKVVRTLAKHQRPAKVLESCHLGKLKEAHANNDKISAIRIGKAYLAGTAKEVWVPDLHTQEQRDLFHAHRKAVKRTTQARNSLLSYLSDNGVRLKQGTRLANDPETEKLLRQAAEWTDLQWRVLQGLLMQLQQAEQQRQHWRNLIAQQVLETPELLSLVRLCGVRDLVAFALGAFIGDIKRFKDPKKLVKYVGLNPSFDDSGQSQWSGGVGAQGNNHLRSLLIQGAQAILRCSQSPLAKWGRKLIAKKGSKNLAVCAVARKLTVAVWYLMMGRWTPVEKIDDQLCIKLNKILQQAHPGKPAKERKVMRDEVYARLANRSMAARASLAADQEQHQEPGVRVYLLDPNKKFTPKVSKTTLAQEYGLKG